MIFITDSPNFYSSILFFSKLTKIQREHAKPIATGYIISWYVKLYLELILEYVNFINYEKHLVIFLVNKKSHICHVSNVKDLLLGIYVDNLLCPTTYHHRQWILYMLHLYLLKKSSVSFRPTNATFQIISRVIFTTLCHHINSSTILKSHLHKFFL